MAIPQYRPQKDYSRQAQPAVQPSVQQPTTTPSQNPSRRSNRRWTKGEKYLLIGMVAIVAIIALVTLNLQSSISQTTIDIDKLNTEIATVQKQNEDLTNEVSEKSTYERFVQKAKELGLTPNADNIKAVSKK
ncbi:MAG: cell division protein FtsL [Kurthia sp.]|nr:cell division protein FtsL [Candidatus Kurthia equi]